MNRRLAIAVTASAVATGALIPAYAADTTVPAQPRLVVGILVEGLTESDLLRYSDRLGSNGIKRIATGGVVIPNVDYGDAATVAAVATVVTGATPNVNGIDAADVYDRAASRTTPIISDPQYLGNFTSEKVSPAALRVSTLADEIKIASGGYSHTYSIAPDAATAIIAGGHSAGSAVWISDADGRWATSTYYKDLPGAVTERNYRSSLSSRIDTMYWTPAVRSSGAFRYDFPRTATDRYRMFKASPRAGDEITALACDYLTHIARSHRDGATDMLTLGYSVAPYPYGLASSASMQQEQADAYRRLDSQIACLLDQVDHTTGLANTLVYIAGIPSEQLLRPTSDIEIATLPSGEFSPRKARALLNMYLMAVYGNGDWVTGYHDRWFYLNTALAEKNGVNISELRTRSAEFLRQMSGVTDASAVEHILSSDARRYVNVAHAGDVRIEIQPGWRLIETDTPAAEGKTLRASARVAPLFIRYPSLQSVRIDTPVDAAVIAPTLARIIRIRAPNAASEAPLPLQSLK